MRRCASKRRQNVPCYRRNILTAMNGTANRFHIVSARFPIRSSLSFMYFVRRARGRERKKGERRRSREKGEWRRNLALTGLHSLKIKLVHHTYTHTHTHIHTSHLFLFHTLFVQPHPLLAPKQIRRAFAIKYENCKPFTSLAFPRFHQHPFDIPDNQPTFPSLASPIPTTFE